MTTYQIIVKNESGDNQKYLFLNQLPAIQGAPAKGLPNVWVKSSGTPSPHGVQSLTITTDIFAMCGLLPQPLGSQVHIQESDTTTVAVTGASEGTLALLELVDGGPAFHSPSKTTSTANAFGIRTGDWNNNQYDDKIWCGLGRYDQNQNIIPVATFTARPNQTYTIVPSLVFYVGTGSYERGTTVDLNELGPLAKIDFSKAQPGQRIATIIQNSNLEYTGPNFSYDS